MEHVTKILEALSEAARENRKEDFDRLERELLSHFKGSFDGMPKEIYDAYLEVDRHWPIVSPRPGDGDPQLLHTISVTLSVDDESWLRSAGAAADRSISAVLAECIASVRNDAELEDGVARRLRAKRPG